MRIGELAALVGVSTRTVRHYHHVGLLPDPQRRVNGYRDYGVRDAVVLARVRRLAELGLSLEEIRDVLADDRESDLREVLLELDADLARQQAAIGARRDRLATLLALIWCARRWRGMRCRRIWRRSCVTCPWAIRRTPRWTATCSP